MAGIDVTAYLRRLGFDYVPKPSVEMLVALHRAHVERVPYENLDIQLGRSTSLDPSVSARRIIAGRGGYCFHLNGALSALLTELGFEVTRHRGGVQHRTDPEPVSADVNHHLLMTVDCGGQRWLVDVGMMDAMHEPVPLASGGYSQGPFEFTISRSVTVAGGWRLAHDPAGPITGIDFSLKPAEMAEFADRHRELSTSPDSVFVRTAIAHRWRADGLDRLRGCVLTTIEAEGRKIERELTTDTDWFATLADVFGIVLDDVDAPQRDAMWRRVRDAHHARLAVTAGRE